MMNAETLAQAWFQKAIGQDELDAKVARAYPAGGWDEYRLAIDAAGNPPDQIERFERARIILQPKQLEFAAWARRMDWVEHGDNERGAPELGIGGAKGPGKSFVIFAVVAVDDCQRYDGLKALYLRKTGKRALEQIQDLVMSVLQYVPHEYTMGKVKFPNGSQMLIGHFNNEKEAMNYAGIEYDDIAVEEATHLSERAYKSIRQSARTSKDWRPRLYNSTNPLGVGHRWYKVRFIDHEREQAKIEERARKFIFATVDDNQFVNVDYRGNLEDLTGVEKRAYLFGDWDVSAGAYFDQWQYDLHVIDPLKPAAGWDVWASMDYGFNHWNMIYLHAKDGDGVVYTFAEIGHRKHHPDEIVPDFKAVLAEYGILQNKLKSFIAGADVFNKTGAAKQTVAEQYEKLGFKITMAEMGPGSRVAGAIHMAGLLGNEARGILPKWYVTRNCARLIDTMPYLERDPHNPEDVLKVDADGDGNGGDDGYDAARYGLYQKGTKQVSSRVKQYA
ncbi:MAG: phage terminase large subunit [Aggregatilineales bacterium]